jgi:hypothetical protein
LRARLLAARAEPNSNTAFLARAQLPQGLLGIFSHLNKPLDARRATMSKTPDWIQYGVPTLDRPFGLQLWPIFSKAYESTMGYKPEDFRFVPGETPLSTFKACATFLISYYIVIFGGREIMRNREPFQLNFLFKVHNFGLTAASFVLLVLFAEELIPTVWRHGLFYAICDHKGGWTDRLVILYYVSFNCPAGAAESSADSLVAQLPQQVPRVCGYLLSVPEEEAIEYARPHNRSLRVLTYL